MFNRIKFYLQLLLFNRNKKKSNQEVFGEIYKKNLWNEEKNAKLEFCSGRGSDDEFAIAYAQVISDFIIENQIETVVDLGCGDFRVASKFIDKCKKYIGVDCVETLIEHHKREYANSKVNFECLDITSDFLPVGNLCLVRQVLQHLSNSEIEKVLNNCKKYPYLIVTEHLLNEPSSKPNMDKVRGMHTSVMTY